jgi:DNA polymerase II small subunit
MGDEGDNLKLRRLVASFLDENVLLSPDLAENPILNLPDEFSFEGLKNKRGLVVVNRDLFGLLDQPSAEKVSWIDFDKSRVLFEKKKELNSYLNTIEYLKKASALTCKKEIGTKPGGLKEELPDSDIIYECLYRDVMAKLEVQNFIGSLNARYKALEGMLSTRRELQNLLSISRVTGKKEREDVSIIGMIRDKEVTNKNKHIRLTVEDPTGTINILVNKNNNELFPIAKDLVEDEVIGIRGTTGDKIIFANSLIYPDVPMYKELKKFPHGTEAMGIMLSDLHVGSTNFLDKELEKGISWIKGEIGSESQRELASKIKYVFILGDLVEGVGVYPDQNKELLIKDIYDQYVACADYLKEIPKNMKLIIIPGNHDAVRIEEPQPPLYDDIASPLFKLPNAMMLSNPCNVNLLSTKDFPGFDFLLYHGYSFTYYADNVESIRQKGGVDRADLIMQFLLQRRHLSPTHTSNIYNPDMKKDPLVIEKIPDFFLSGHLHKTIVSTYKNISLISGSCWQSRTSFMEKMGIHPEPARIPVINFNTREVKIMRFGK